MPKMFIEEVQAVEESSKAIDEVESAQSCAGMVYQAPLDCSRDHRVKFEDEVEEIPDLETEAEVEADYCSSSDLDTTWETDLIDRAYECSYYTERIGTVVPYRLFTIKIALLGDCRPNCAICQPYVDDVGQLTTVLDPALAKVSCYWQRSPAGSNIYIGSCRLDRILSPSTSQRYSVTLTVPATRRNFELVNYFYYLTADLYPPKCGPLIWTPYPPRSLQAGKQATFKVPLRDLIGFVKNSTTGALSAEVAKAFSSAVALSFSNQISNISSQYSETEGALLFTFIPMTCGTWRAKAGIKGWKGPGPRETLFDGSPFELTIKAGDISIRDSRGFWLNNVNAFRAGEFGTLRVLLMDAFMNNITKDTGRTDFYSFNVFSTDASQRVARCIVSMSQEQQAGFEDVIINNTLIGSYKLHVGAADSRRIAGSPFTYSIVPGDLWVEQCTAEWLISPHIAGKSSSLRVYLRDRYGNLLVGNSNIIKFNIYTYTASGNVVYEEASYRLQSDMPQFEYITFTSYKAGLLSLYVSYGSKQIKGSPLELARLPGAVSTLYFLFGVTL
ncbi:hypothetical protein L7F22_059804 [Adiantum nelumboides]|nr:hypothetical protein [Adiantum nelumboides]